jgi:hypothetical protein
MTVVMVNRTTRVLVGVPVGGLLCQKDERYGSSTDRDRVAICNCYKCSFERVEDANGEVERAERYCGMAM